MNKSFLFAVLTVFSFAFLQGCSTTPEEEPEPPAPVESPAPAPAPAAEPARTDLPTFLANMRTVNFAYNRSDISKDFQDLITAHGRFLAGNRQFKVVVEGHTDERGSNEYNLALGQRRADAVRQMLLSLGAQASQVRAVSFGEEKPIANGSNEAAWSQNRRAVLSYERE